MNSPGTILKLWLKAVKKHEEGKEPAELDKKGQDQKTRIKKGLTNLKRQGQSDLDSPDQRAYFENFRDRAAALMKKYCRFLKGAKGVKGEERKVQDRLLAAVKRLTVLGQKLDGGDVDAGEEDASLDSIAQ